MIFLAFNILTSGVPFSMVCAVIALVAAFFLIAAVVRSPAGNQRMQEIAGAVQEGAKAYLNRQVITISSIAAIIFILLFIFKDWPTAIGFMIGAFCSLSAGYIGMRIAVVANVVCDRCRVARIIFFETLLDLAHKVRPDVSRFGVDPAAESREHADETSPEGETNQTIDRHMRAGDTRDQSVEN